MYMYVYINLYVVIAIHKDTDSRVRRAGGGHIGRRDGGGGRDFRG